IRQMWANERHYTGVDYLGVSYAAVPPLTHFQTNSTYFLWDVFSTAYVGKPNLFKQYDVKASVYTEGPSQGRTYIDEQNGRLLSVMNHVEHNDFFNYITKLAKKVK